MLMGVTEPTCQTRMSEHQKTSNIHTQKKSLRRMMTTLPPSMTKTCHSDLPPRPVCAHERA